MADKKTTLAASAPLSTAPPTPQPTASPAATLAPTPVQRPPKELKPKDSKPKDPKPVRGPNPAKDAKPAKGAKPAKDAKATDSSKLTAKQLKEQKKAEKAARRADTKAATGAPPPQQTGPQRSEKHSSPPAHVPASAIVGGGIVKTIYPTNPATVVAKEVEVVVAPARDNGLVGLLRDLAVDQQDKKKAAAVFGIGNAHPDVHPAILTLGMQINQYVLAGSTARCLGFLLAMKRVWSIMSHHSFF